MRSLRIFQICHRSPLLRVRFPNLWETNRTIIERIHQPILPTGNLTWTACPSWPSIPSTIGGKAVEHVLPSASSAREDPLSTRPGGIEREEDPGNLVHSKLVRLIARQPMALRVVPLLWNCIPLQVSQHVFCQTNAPDFFSSCSIKNAT